MATCAHRAAGQNVPVMRVCSVVRARRLPCSFAEVPPLPAVVLACLPLCRGELGKDLLLQPLCLDSEGWLPGGSGLDPHVAISMLLNNSLGLVTGPR